MSNTVWLSQYDVDSVIPVFTFQASYPRIYDVVERFKLDAKEVELGLSEQEQQHKKNMIDDFIKLGDTQQTGGYIAKENMPTQLYLMPDSDAPQFDEAMFRIATGMFVVNQVCYDIMVQANLGKTHFSQVTFYDMATQEKLTGIPYYFINLAEQRQFLDNKNSSGIRGSFYTPDEPERFILDPKDDDIIVSKEALETDVDMWFDPLLYNSVFIADELIQKLFKAGFTKKSLGLVSCQVK